ncbi:IL23R protein, partial [Psilopogon haemacephalus]|nr:IL23R protein [Psilopogon haemacephalus]
GRSLSTTFLLRAYGRHTFTCRGGCGHRSNLICGLDLHSGAPPDAPRNVSCVQQGAEGHPTCTWDNGRLTYIHTAYLLR